MKPCVLLLHGLGESELRMLPVSLFLNQMGYRPINVSYPSTCYPSVALAEQYVMPVLKDLEKEKVLHVVTHSMGGILLRYCLEKRKQKNLKRVVMMTPANHGSAVMEMHRQNPLLSFLYGPVLQESGLNKHCFSCTLKENIEGEVGIISGCIPLEPLAPLLLPWLNDGKASVESTKLEGMKDHITLPAAHELISFHPWAIYQTHHFLRFGKFYRS